jgi:hypothetical protein
VQINAFCPYDSHTRLIDNAGTNVELSILFEKFSKSIPSLPGKNPFMLATSWYFLGIFYILEKQKKRQNRSEGRYSPGIHPEQAIGIYLAGEEEYRGDVPDNMSFGYGVASFSNNMYLLILLLASPSPVTK